MKGNLTLNKLIFIFVSCILLISCATFNDGYIGKNKKDLILKFGAPYKESKIEGFDVVQFRTKCFRDTTISYCYIREFFIDNDKTIKHFERYEYYNPVSP
ncbi:MAG: hypothetical protein APR62_00695 [Smithella sp. SDB]|nr:MAG: hypothetical protein APR62_00695 [Smithella sp. SDB]